MDLVGRKPNMCNGSNPLKRVSNEEGDKEEKEALLRSALKGVGVKRKRNSRRRVQWNDRNGEKLVQVLEFETSDLSDFEDDYLDTCICTIM